MERIRTVSHREVTRMREAAIGGFVFFALVILHANLRNGAPSATAPARDVVDFVTDHQWRLQLGAVAIAFAMAAALVWLSGLVQVLRRVEGGTAGLSTIALGGGIVAAAASVTTALVQATVAARIVDLGVDSVRPLWTMFLLSTGATLIGLLVVIGATAVASLEQHVFPTWFVVSTLLVLLVSIVGAGTIGFTTAWIQATAGVAVLFDAVWILLVSILLWRHPDAGLS